MNWETLRRMIDPRNETVRKWRPVLIDRSHPLNPCAPCGAVCNGGKCERMYEAILEADKIFTAEHR